MRRRKQSGPPPLWLSFLPVDDADQTLIGDYPDMPMVRVAAVPRVGDEVMFPGEPYPWVVRKVHWFMSTGWISLVTIGRASPPQQIARLHVARADQT